VLVVVKFRGLIRVASEREKLKARASKRATAGCHKNQEIRFGLRAEWQHTTNHPTTQLLRYFSTRLRSLLVATDYAQ
jgi:hypothetical protein